MNDNCLDGIHCPHCNSLGPFTIGAQCLAEVTDDGIESSQNFWWSDDSNCQCGECGAEGSVKDFKVKVKA